jgi:predicted nuclease of predicted toxin-antitoxin system
MKFLVDMSISPKTVEFLRKQGYEAVRVIDMGMAKYRDEEILGYAIEKGMVLITTDLDFGNIFAYTKSKRPSTIIFRLKNPSPSSLIKCCY